MEFFSLRNNVKKNASNNKDSLSIKELISKLDILFEEQLSKAFKDIMILPRNIFLNIIISEVKTFIDEQYGEDIYKNEKFINFFSSSCNNLEDKYNTYLDELTKAWDDYQININLKNENIYFFSNFRKHCLGTDNYAMHSCSNGGYGYFIQVTKKTKKGTINPKKKNIPNSQIQYLICNKCKTVYFNNRFMNYCKKCNISYLCSILSYNEDPDLLLATLEKPHCDTLVNEKLKCSKCKDNNLYLNMKLNKLQCHNKSCTYNVVPYNIEWTCNQCSKIFHSNVKVYNPIEIQEIKDIINITLLLKKKAHPSKITCCKNINVLTEDFFHKKECKGLLYFGVYNSKTIIVCDKCKAINFLFKFIWTCPKCGTRFKEGEEKSKYYLSPKHENKRQINHKNNRLNESINDENNINNNIKPYSEMKTNNINRKNKETLSSILKRKSAKNISELSNNDNNTFRPKVMLDTRSGSAWYVAGGESTIGRMIADANAEYIFADNKKSGSVPLSFETVFEKARDADVWLLKNSGSVTLTYSLLESDFKSYSSFKPFKEHNIWVCNVNEVPYFELTSFHPEMLLGEFISIFHPEISNGRLFYHPLEE